MMAPSRRAFILTAKLALLHDRVPPHTRSPTGIRHTVFTTVSNNALLGIPMGRITGEFELEEKQASMPSPLFMRFPAGKRSCRRLAWSFFLMRHPGTRLD